MNSTIVQYIGSFKLGQNAWIKVVVLSVLLGLLAALAVPVHVH